MSEPKKFIVTVRPGVSPHQIDDWPKDCERSCEGSLHVKPGTYELTEGELKHIRKHHKALNRCLQVTEVKPKEKPKAKAKAKAASKAKATPKKPEPEES